LLLNVIAFIRLLVVIIRHLFLFETLILGNSHPPKNPTFQTQARATGSGSIHPLQPCVKPLGMSVLQQSEPELYAGENGGFTPASPSHIWLELGHRTRFRQPGPKILGLTFADQLHVFTTAHQVTVSTLQHGNHVSANVASVNLSFFGWHR
jgi:hypothetical protein